VGNIKLISGKGKKSKKKDKKVKTKARRWTGAKTAVTIIIILLVGVAAFVLSLKYYVGNLDTVYPNVWADGVLLSGMTFEEAMQALIDEGYESNAASIFATIVFPNESSFTISGEDVGLALSAWDAAKAAFDFGRDGSFFSDEIAYARSLLSRTELSDLSIATLDEDYVREVAAEYTKLFNDELIKDTFSISDESITILKGTGIEPADEDAVFNLAMETLMRAIDEQTHVVAHYIPEAAEHDEVDLALLFATIHVDEVSSVYDPETYGATDSSTGITFDLPGAQAMMDSAGTGESIVIPLITLEPEVTREEIESLLFRDELATRTTKIAGTSNRLNNIVLSSSTINGTILNPGDVFSFNGIVGQRTAGKGYKEAGAYVGGKVVQEIGGGICQTSSTIYDCVLHTDLEVVERLPHRYIVTYLPLGNDATINWGSIDFKFRNNTDYPIRIEAVVNVRDLSVKLIGTKLDDTYIKVDYTLISKTPYQTIRREDASVPPGQTVEDAGGYTGHVVDTYKSLYDADGNLIRKTLVGRSTYRVQDRVILVPPASSVEPTDPATDPTPTADPTPTPPTGTPTAPPTTSPTAPPTDTPTAPPTDTTDPPPTGSPASPTEEPTTAPPTQPADPTGDQPPPDPGWEDPSGSSRQEPD